MDPDLSPRPLTSAKHRSEYPQRILRALDLAAAAAGELLALALPVDCVCCGAEDLAICAACEVQVRLLTRRPFRAEAQASALMDVNGSVLLPVVAAGIYREELAQAVLAFKKHGQRPLQRVLARGLGRAIMAATSDARGIALVPVPSSNGAFRKRGFSPIHLLLKNLRRYGVLAGMPVQDVLRKNSPLAAPGLISGGQKGLSRGARARRVRSSMHVAGSRIRGIHGRQCIIVDDVLTTGATLAEAARAVHQAGGIVTGAVVLAATRPPRVMESQRLRKIK